MAKDTLAPTLPLTPEEIERKKVKKAKKAKKKFLSGERTFLAFDRTLLAWVRTSTSLLTFGFAIIKLLEQKAADPGKHPVLKFITPTAIGMLMIFSGFVGLWMAVTSYVKYAKEFERKTSSIYFNPAMIVSYVVLLLCFLILVGGAINGFANAG